MSALVGDAAVLRCCDGHHAMGCTDDPPWTICCWRCPVNPSPSPEALTEAIRKTP